MVMLQGHYFWDDFCRHMGHEEWITDERFDSPENWMANAQAARDEIRAEMSKRTLAEWTERFATLNGQWAPVQNTVEVAADPQVRANGYIQGAVTPDGVEFELAASPVQFDEEPTPTDRSPEFNEHGDEILQGLGYDWDAILEMKAAGAVT